MGRIEVSEIVQNVTPMNPPYTYHLDPALRTLGGTTYYPVPNNNNVICPYTDYRQAAYWSINRDGSTSAQITPTSWSDVENIEICCKFKMTNTQLGYIQELFSLCGQLTPDLTTNNTISLWDSANGQYWLEYPFSNNIWYWLKVYYDVDTYTQTWSISEDGENFTVIGVHTEDRNSYFQYNWNSTSSSDISYLSFGCLNLNYELFSDGRYLQGGVIDMNETYIKTNGIIRCRGYITGSI